MSGGSVQFTEEQLEAALRMERDYQNRCDDIYGDMQWELEMETGVEDVYELIDAAYKWQMERHRG